MVSKQKVLDVKEHEIFKIEQDSKHGIVKIKHVFCKKGPQLFSVSPQKLLKGTLGLFPQELGL